jgi:ankyrin repeat protein
MNKNLIFTLTVLLIGSSLFGQEISKETLRAIHDGNITVLDKVVSKENVNDCFDIQDSSYNYLSISIKMKQIKSLKYFAEKEANLEKVCAGKTPLMYAVKYGYLEMVKYLVNKGAKMTTETSRGKTALDYAEKYDQYEIAEYLKDKLRE